MGYRENIVAVELSRLGIPNPLELIYAVDGSGSEVIARRAAGVIQSGAWSIHDVNSCVSALIAHDASLREGAVSLAADEDAKTSKGALLTKPKKRR